MFEAILGSAIVITVITGLSAIIKIYKVYDLYFLGEVKSLFRRAYFQIPILFICLNFLYILPLSVRCFFSLEVSGDISPQLADFYDYIPAALIVQSVFFLLFSYCYCHYLGAVMRRKIEFKIKNFNEYNFILFSLIILAISVFMIGQLALSVGGIFPMILSGYRVTELFVGKNHLAVAFDWISGLSVVLFSYALFKKSKAWIGGSSLFIILLSACYAIMGRRAAIVVLGVSIIVAIHFGHREIKWKELLLVLISGFVALNLIGLIRGDSYDDISNLIEIVIEKNDRNQESEAANFYYTLTEGNFAVPFETLPQIMSRWGESIIPRAGLTIIESLELFVPNALWPERPLPIPNWYMREFYDANTPMNEGRQFYFLSEAYLNFGPPGAALWALLYSVGIIKLLKFFEVRKNNPLFFALFSLMIGNSLTFISSDLIGGLVAFAKGGAFPVIFLIVINNFRMRSN